MFKVMKSTDDLKEFLDEAMDEMKRTTKGIQWKVNEHFRMGMYLTIMYISSSCFTSWLKLKVCGLADQLDHKPC